VLSTILSEVKKEEGSRSGDNGSGGGTKPSIYAEEIAKMFIRAPSSDEQEGGEGGAGE